MFCAGVLGYLTEQLVANLFLELVNAFAPQAIRLERQFDGCLDLF
jgi:hypothetical protein